MRVAVTQALKPAAGTPMRPRMFSRIPVFLLVCALTWFWVPEVDAQSSRSSYRNGVYTGSGRTTHRRNPGEDWRRESLERENDRLEKELDKERKRRWEAEHGDDEEEERGPSGGPACMYAADGTLVFAPRGRTCKGASASATKKTPRPKRAASTTKKATGSCMMGADGSVIYAPPGVDCGG